jgi:hypothetical protein
MDVMAGPGTRGWICAARLRTASLVTPGSPMVTHALQMVSAGHTGCLPEENQISNVKMNLDGSGTWNATCKARVYLCSAFQGVSNSESYSCAPVAQ